MPFQCEIVTQERAVFNGEVDYVSLPGGEGRMGILPNHSPMLTALDYGEVMVRVSGQEQYFAVGGGFAEIQPTKVIVLADSAEKADEIDLERAQESRARAARAMSEGEREDPNRHMQIEAALKRAQIRIDVSMRRRGARRRASISELRGEEDTE